MMNTVAMSFPAAHRPLRSRRTTPPSPSPGCRDAHAHGGAATAPGARASHREAKQAAGGGRLPWGQ
eukprot:15292728-Heterocapsa_arctica.AAC.1